MMKRKCLVIAALFAVVALLYSVQPSEAAPQRLKFGIAVSENSTWYKGAEKFAELVKERTGGRYTVDLFASDQLAASNIIKSL